MWLNLLLQLPPTALETIIKRFREKSNPNGVCPTEGVKIPALTDPLFLTLNVLMIFVTFSVTTIQFPFGVKDICGASTAVALNC